MLDTYPFWFPDTGIIASIRLSLLHCSGWSSGSVDARQI